MNERDPREYDYEIVDPLSTFLDGDDDLEDEDDEFEDEESDVWDL